MSFAHLNQHQRYQIEKQLAEGKSVAVIARSAAMDQYLMQNPGYLFDAPREAVSTQTGMVTATDQWSLEALREYRPLPAQHPGDL